jgi:hypothetical protein
MLPSCTAESAQLSTPAGADVALAIAARDQFGNDVTDPTALAGLAVTGLQVAPDDGLWSAAWRGGSAAGGGGAAGGSISGEGGPALVVSPLSALTSELPLGVLFR